MRRVLVALFLLGVSVSQVQAQEVEEFTQLILTDGSQLVGNILDETDQELRFMTLSGLEFTIRVEEIESRKTIRARLRNGKLVKFDPNVSRLFFSATGRPVPKGTGYFSLHELFFASGGIGVSESFVFAGGISLFPGLSEQLVYLAPKATVYNKNNRSFSVGALLGTVTGESGYGGIFYGAGTFGPEDQAITIGTGFLFGGGDVVSTPIIMIGAEKQLGSRTKFITENYFMPGISANGVLSLGIRIIGDRLTTDVAALTHTAVLNEGGFPLFPWVSFSYNFGH